MRNYSATYSDKVCCHCLTKKAKVCFEYVLYMNKAEFIPNALIICQNTKPKMHILKVF